MIEYPTSAKTFPYTTLFRSGLKGRLLTEALRRFYQIREAPGLKKKPSTSELLDWLKLLLAEDMDPETLREADPRDRKSTRLNSSHVRISYAVFSLKKKTAHT